MRLSSANSPTSSYCTRVAWSLGSKDCLTCKLLLECNWYFCLMKRGIQIEQFSSLIYEIRRQRICDPIGWDELLDCVIDYLRNNLMVLRIGTPATTGLITTTMQIWAIGGNGRNIMVMIRSRRKMRRRHTRQNIIQGWWKFALWGCSAGGICSNMDGLFFTDRWGRVIWHGVVWWVRWTLAGPVSN